MNRHFYALFLCFFIYLIAGCTFAEVTPDAPVDSTKIPISPTERGPTNDTNETSSQQNLVECPIDSVSLLMVDTATVGEDLVVKVDLPQALDANISIQYEWTAKHGIFQSGQITTGPSNVYLAKQEGADPIKVNLTVSKDGREIESCRDLEDITAISVAPAIVVAVEQIATEAPVATVPITPTAIVVSSGISSSTNISTGDVDNGVIVGGNVDGDISIVEAVDYRVKTTVEGETPDAIILLMKEPQTNPLTGFLDLFDSVQEDGVNSLDDLINTLNENNFTVAENGFVIDSGTEVEVVGEPVEVLTGAGGLDNLPDYVQKSLSPFVEGMTMTPVKVLSGQYAGEEGWVISNLIRTTEVPETE